MTNSPIEPQRGFSLIELAIVLIVAGLLAGSLLASGQGLTQRNDEARAARLLNQTQEALYGFAVTHGRLPCPADPTQDSEQAGNAGHEDCSREHGVLPWQTLALPETDPWGQRLTYYVRQSFTIAPSADARAGFTLNTTGNANIRPHAGAGNKLADNLPAVIVSHGRNGLGGYRRNGQRTAASQPDESENADADLIFINRLPDDVYDDLVLWLVPSILNSRLLAAGRLP